MRTLNPTMLQVLLVGLFGMLLIGVQMLVGYRKIKFKGKTHWRVHKGIAWLILLIGVGHALWALLWLGWIPL